MGRQKGVCVADIFNGSLEKCYTKKRMELIGGKYNQSDEVEMREREKERDIP